MSLPQSPGTSPEAKAATHKQIQGTIDFLNLQLAHQNAELIKYQDFKNKYHLVGPFTDIAIAAVKHAIASTTASRDYYVTLLNQYIAAGYA
jgi:hypothetical protein